MKKLLILFLAMAAVGCKEGGILNDHNVFMSDSLASAVKKVPILFEATMPMYVTDDGGLLLVEDYVSSVSLDQEFNSKRIAKILPDGSKTFLQMPEPHWIVNGNVSQESIEQFAPDILPIDNLLKGSDGSFYSLGISQPRFQSEFLAFALTKFDSGLKIVYNYCALFALGDDQPLPYNVNNGSSGVPLDNGRFAVLLKMGDEWQNQAVYSAKIFAADGTLESEIEFAPEFGEYSGGTIYSCGDNIINDCTDFTNVQHIRSFSSKGEFLYEQIATGKCARVSYTGRNTILTCFEEFEPKTYEGPNGYQITVTNGKFYYTDITPELTGTEVRDFNGSDSTYIVMGGVYCGGSQILYGYCRQCFRSNFGVDYFFNENDAKGFIIKDEKLYTVAGTSSKAILGVWYSGGTYTVYYDERLPEADWNRYVTIIKTNDLNKLNN